MTRYEKVLQGLNRTHNLPRNRSGRRTRERAMRRLESFSRRYPSAAAELLTTYLKGHRTHVRDMAIPRKAG